MSSVQATSLLFQVPTPGIARRELRAFARKLASDVGQGRSFCCLITNDDELHRLNREFRKKDCATDVLSFPSGDGNGFLGEIAISFARAREQAREYNLPVSEELQILMLHGILHLLGMDHETDRGQMARAEAKWRAVLGLSRGLIERVRP